jgi:hypothetical protein
MLHSARGSKSSWNLRGRCKEQISPETRSTCGRARRRASTTLPYRRPDTRFSVARPHGSGVSGTTVLALTLKLQTISQSRSPCLSRLMFAMEDRRTGMQKRNCLVDTYRCCDIIIDMRISSHTTLERFPAVAPIAKNSGCVAVLSFAEPAPAHNFRQSPTSSADNFLPKQQKQRGGLRCRRRRDALPAPPGLLARGMARQQHRRTGPAIRYCARGRAADAEPATETQRPATYRGNFAVDSLYMAISLIIGSTQRCFPEKRRRACWRPRQDGGSG